MEHCEIVVDGEPRAGHAGAASFGAMRMCLSYRIRPAWSIARIGQSVCPAPLCGV